jgi:hypothetical protein
MHEAGIVGVVVEDAKQGGATRGCPGMVEGGAQVAGKPGQIGDAEVGDGVGHG